MTNAYKSPIQPGAKALNPRATALLPDLQTEFLVKLARLRFVCSQHGINIGKPLIHRSAATQKMLYCQGRTRPGSIVTNADAWQSPHQYDLAADCQLSWMPKPPNHGELDLHTTFGICVSTVKLTWGGNFRSIHDPCHVELPGWPKGAKTY